MGDRAFATKLFNQAVKAATDKSNESNLTTAYQLFASACVADPTLGSAHYQMGNNNFDLKKLPAAIAAYRRALHCDLDTETRARCLVNLGWCYHLEGDTARAIQVTEEARKLDDTLTHVWMHLSVLAGLYGRTEQAVDYAEQAIACATTDIQNAAGTDDATFKNHQRQLLESRIALAFALLFDGQYEQAFELFELRFEWRLHSFLQMPYPKWLGEPGKIVFLVADQGLGDTLSFARFVEETCRRAKYVHAYIQPELMRLFLHSLGHLPNLNLIPNGSPYPQADCWTTFVSLPFALKLSTEQVVTARQIKPPLYDLPKTWKVPDTRLHIGIAWAGSALNDIDKYRNVPVEQFLELYKVPGIQLYGLQVGPRAQELNDCGGVSLIRDLSPYIRDVCDTVSLLQNLDLVICCESALGHICALADKECWIPYSWSGRDYRIGQRGEKLLWTPKHQVFCQKQGETWQPVFDRIIQRLKDKLDVSRRAA